MTRKQIKKWVKERDEAILSFDIETYKAHYRKWKKIGVYQLELPSDWILEVTMRKMALHINSATKAQKDEAAKWLINRGFTTEVF